MAITVEIKSQTLKDIRRFHANLTGKTVPLYFIIKEEGQENYWGADVNLVQSSENEEIWNMWGAIITPPPSGGQEKTINKAFLVGQTSAMPNLDSLEQAIDYLKKNLVEEIAIIEVTYTDPDKITIVGGRSENFYIKLVYGLSGQT